jgi:hypothetical protein
MKTLRLWIIGAVCPLLLAGSMPTRVPHDDLPGRGQPAVRLAPSNANQEWIQVQPGGDSNCAFDTPFSFFHHEGKAPTKLLVYFEGGGACWEFVSCSGMFDTNVTQDELAGFRGIFDFTNRENPFRDFSVLFIPYCTGDVHIGDTLQYYGDRATSHPVAHRGYRNVSAALAWLARRPGPAPTQIVVSGTSAGSYGALFHAPTIARMYPSASITMIGDSGIPLLKNYPDILARWGSAGVIARIRHLAEPLPRSELALERAYTYFAEVRPKSLVAEVTMDGDAVQSGFYLISGSPAAHEATHAILDSVARAVPGFRSFVLAGGDHGLFVTDKFYSYAIDGARLVDWMQQALDGRPVQTRRCTGCVGR